MDNIRSKNGKILEKRNELGHTEYMVGRVKRIDEINTK